MAADGAQPSGLQSHFAQVRDELGGAGPIGTIVTLLTRGELTEDSFAEVLETFGAAGEPWLRPQLLDLVLGYIQASLADGARLTAVNEADVRELRRIFDIRDREFMELRSAELAAILNQQREVIVKDGVIDGDEELYGVELQAVFGVGYDDFLALCRRAFETAHAELTARSRNSPEAVAKLDALESLYRLATMRHRRLGALY